MASILFHNVASTVAHFAAFDVWNSSLTGMVHFLYELRCKPSTPRYVIAFKVVIYLWLILITIRCYLVAIFLLMKPWLDFADYLRYDPLVQCLATNFHFIDPYMAIAGI